MPGGPLAALARPPILPGSPNGQTGSGVMLCPMFDEGEEVSVSRSRLRASCIAGR